MSTPMDPGTFLLLEGAVVAALVVLRCVAVRVVGPETMPSVMRSRVDLGDRLTPFVAVSAAVMLVVGAVLLASG